MFAFAAIAAPFTFHPRSGSKTKEQLNKRTQMNEKMRIKEKYATLCAQPFRTSFIDYADGKPSQSEKANTVTATQRAELLSLGDSPLPPQDPDDADSIADCVDDDILPATLGPHGVQPLILVSMGRSGSSAIWQVSSVAHIP